MMNTCTGGNIQRSEFFLKPMSTNLCVQARSTLREGTKQSSLAEEIARLRSTSRRVDKSSEILEVSSSQMAPRGHKQVFNRKAVIKICPVINVSFINIVILHFQGGKLICFHRTASTDASKQLKV